MLIIRRIAILPGHQLSANPLSPDAILLKRKLAPTESAAARQIVVRRHKRRKPFGPAKKRGQIISPDGFTSMRATDNIFVRWRFAVPLVETSPEILTKPVDNGSDLAVLFPFALKRGPVFEN
jgi:hypothetical protein